MNLKQFKHGKKKNNGGKFIPLTKLTLDDHKEYTFYHGSETLENSSNSTLPKSSTKKTPLYSEASKAKYFTAFSAVNEYVNAPQAESARLLDAKQHKMNIALKLAGMDPKWETFAQDSRKISQSARRDISLVFADYRQDVNKDLPLGTTNKQKKEQIRDTINKSQETQAAALVNLQKQRDERLREARKAEEVRDNLDNKKKERAIKMKNEKEKSRAEDEAKQDKLDMRFFFGRTVDTIFGKNRDF